MVSIIVTVHNADKYIRECLDSVVNQTYKDIEIICVDGGSKDLSPEILKEYQARDNRIRIINDINTSYGHKINIGIKEAKGDYVAVIESDDIYENNMVEILIADGAFSIWTVAAILLVVGFLYLLFRPTKEAKEYKKAAGVN